MDAATRGIIVGKPVIRWMVYGLRLVGHLRVLHRPKGRSYLKPTTLKIDKIYCIIGEGNPHRGATTRWRSPFLFQLGIPKGNNGNAGTVERTGHVD
jgi:hypothetical protein